MSAFDPLRTLRESAPVAEINVGKRPVADFAGMSACGASWRMLPLSDLKRAVLAAIAEQEHSATRAHHH